MKHLETASMLRLVVIFLAVLTATPAAAQFGQVLHLPDAPAEAKPERARSPLVISPGLFTPQGQALARQYHTAKAAGRLPRPAKTSGDDLSIGDARVFRTQRFLKSFTWIETDFTLKAQGDGFRLWVETGELDNGHVTDADVDALVEALTERTPEGSVDPNQGILANNATLFGDGPEGESEVPNIDGDGILDILWYDIVDFFPGFPTVLGYIAPEDYAPNPPQGVGNAADVLYLDTDPLLVGDSDLIDRSAVFVVDAYGVEAAAQLAAWIHQQLIHFHQDPDESGFVSQGLGAWGALLNGYDTCEGTYLRAPTEHWGIPFFAWSPAALFQEDAQRAGLFTAYLADQLGREAGTALTAELGNGPEGVRAVLNAQGAARSAEDLVFDFHLANYVAGASSDPRFAYAHPACQDVQSPPTGQLDGSLGSDLGPDTLAIRAGGVQYLAWENVYNIEIGIEPLQGVDQEEQLRVRAVLERLDGSVEVRDLPSGSGTHQIEGNFAWMTLVVYFAELDDLDAVAVYKLTASWEDTAVFTEVIVYDDGQARAEDGTLIVLGPEYIQATRFEVPAGSRLHRVYLAPYFRNQLTDGQGNINGDPADPRDFTLHVWADDGTGVPGTELLAVEMDDPRPWDTATTTLLHVAVDLSDRPELDNLPDVIYVGLSEAGNDENVLMMVMSEYTVENTSFLFGPIGGRTDWFPLWNLTQGDSQLDNRTFPIRAQFRNDAIRTDTDDPAEVPVTIALAQNYPNPFNPTTTIRYDLPQRTTVRLAVYDVLGREVAVLVNGLQAGGAYQVPLDASGWASGMYFYTLTTDQRTLTRRMLLIK